MDAVLSNIGVWIGDLGPWAYIIAPVVMAVVSVLPVPAEAPAMANGMLFGPVVGSLITWIGAMAGASISYEIAAAWGRPLAGRMVGRSALVKVDRVVEGARWWDLLVVRFIPVVAFTALNWGAGLFAVPRARFLWTTAVGIIPGVVLFTSSGVGLEVLWRWSPRLTAALVVLVIGASAAWAYRRRGGAVES